MKNQCIENHKCIVFGPDHYNPLGVIRSLGEKGVYPIVILWAEKPVLVNHSKYISELYVVKSIEEGFNILISKFNNELEKPFLFLTMDKIVSYIDSHYNEVKRYFITYNGGGEQGRLNWLMNKDNITNLGIEAGLEVPQKEVVDTGILPHNVKYPIITKVLDSTMGAWKGDVHICHNEAELVNAFTTIKAPKLIIQEYIKKKGEFCFEGFSINDGQDIFLPYVFDYIRYYDDSYGHFMTVTPVEESEFIGRIRDLFKLSRFNGIFEIEFMKGPEDENYFLEINLRASTWNYAPTVGGANLPYLWAKSTLLGRIPQEEFSIRKRPFTAMVEITDFFNNCKNGDVSLIQWIKEFKNSECTYTFNKKDNKPFYFVVWDIIKSKLKKIGGYYP